MPKSLSQKYPLIPTVEPRPGERGPFALMPAVPVLLGGLSGIRLYSLLDTGAMISVISEDTLLELQRAGVSISKRPSGNVVTAAGPTVVQSVTVHLVLCDGGFNPWFEMRSVPFLVLAPSAGLQYPSRILLGYESCLARLRVEIDYPNSSLTVHVADRLKRRGANLEPQFPARIAEGERLIALGSYAAAVYTVFVAIEEALLAVVGPQAGVAELRKDWSHWVEGSVQGLGVLTPDIKGRLQQLRRLRNTAVHHPDQGAAITKSDAEMALSLAKEVIQKIPQQI